MSRQPTPAEIAARLEDVQWMAETGECLTGAAIRLELSRDALENWLRRRDPRSLALLIEHEPKDHNRIQSGLSVSDLTGQRGRRYARRVRSRTRQREDAA